jgi:hypothetical protein
MGGAIPPVTPTDAAANNTTPRTNLHSKAALTFIARPGHVEFRSDSIETVGQLVRGQYTNPAGTCPALQRVGIGI